MEPQNSSKKIWVAVVIIVLIVLVVLFFGGTKADENVVPTENQANNAPAVSNTLLSNEIQKELSATDFGDLEGGINGLDADINKL